MDIHGQYGWFPGPLVAIEAIPERSDELGSCRAPNTEMRAGRYLCLIAYEESCGGKTAPQKEQIRSMPEEPPIARSMSTAGMRILSQPVPPSRIVPRRDVPANYKRGFTPAILGSGGSGDKGEKGQTAATRYFWSSGDTIHNC